MVELQLELAFVCSACDEGLEVTVKCEGKGLAAGARVVAACRVPCPYCAAINQVHFRPTGEVLDVWQVEHFARLLVPSMN